MKIFLLFIFLTLFAWSEQAKLFENNANDVKVRYDNFEVHRVKTESATKRQIITKLLKESQNYNVWQEDKNELQLMINPKAVHIFKNLTKAADIETEMSIENVQELIDAEQAPSTFAADTGSFGWTRYYTWNDMEAWLDGILKAYPEVTESFIIGQTYEGRSIRGIKISHNTDNPGIFIESNIHAREWITSATCTWFINELLTSKDPEVQNLAKNFDWYIVPVLNIDGFVYTHTTNRNWRKTRQPHATSPCIGVDGNRNFDSFWMVNDGASDDPCSDRFAGDTPWSEPEMKSLADYVSSIKDKLSLYLSFHSCGQYLLSPYGHTKDEYPANYDELLKIGEAFANAIAALPYGTAYKYGSTATTIYVASGSSVDWAYNELGFKVAYTIEFRDQGRYCHILPPVQILPNCEELRAGIIALVKKTQELGYI